MINGYLYFSDTSKQDIKTDSSKINVTDILEGGQEISSDWLKKEAVKVYETKNPSKGNKQNKTSK
jgi:hypothetical protein